MPGKVEDPHARDRIMLSVANYCFYSLDSRQQQRTGLMTTTLTALFGLLGHGFCLLLNWGDRLVTMIDQKLTAWFVETWPTNLGFGCLYMKLGWSSPTRTKTLRYSQVNIYFMLLRCIPFLAFAICIWRGCLWSYACHWYLWFHFWFPV